MTLPAQPNASPTAPAQPSTSPPARTLLGGDPYALIRRQSAGGRVQYGGLTSEELTRVHSNALDPREQPEQPDPLEGLNPTERWIIDAFAGVSQTVSNALTPFRQTELYQAAQTWPILGTVAHAVQWCLNAFDAGAEFLVERPTGLIRQYATAKEEGTVEDFWANLGRNWSAAHFTYDVYGSMPRWDEESQGYVIGGANMPGDSEMALIQRYVDQGLSTEDITTRMQTDMGSMFYRGMLADAAGHVLWDPFNILMSPTVIGPVTGALRRAVRAGTTLVGAETLLESTELIRIAAERIPLLRIEQAAGEAELVRISSALETTEDVALVARRAEVQGEITARSTRIQAELDMALTRTQAIQGVRAPGRVDEALMHFFGSGRLPLGEGPEEIAAAHAILEEAPRALAAIPEGTADVARRAQELDRLADAATSGEEFTRLTQEAADLRATISATQDGLKSLDLQEQVVRATATVARGEESERLLRVIQEGASLWKPWTWFRLRPESHAMELYTRVADGFLVMLNRADTPEQLGTIFHSFQQAIMNPKLGMSILTIQGRALSSVAQTATVYIDDLLRGFAECAPERGWLQNFAAALTGEGPTIHASDIMGRIDDGKTVQLLADLRRAAAGQTETAATVRALLGQGDPQTMFTRLREMFLGDNARPFDMESLRLHAIGRVNTATQELAIAQFGVITENVWDKATNVLKACESLAYLRLNPSYPIRNFLNNELTLWARGVWNAMGQDGITEYWRVIGFEPTRLGEGFGVATENEVWANIQRVTTREARDMLRSEIHGDRDVFSRAVDFISSRRLMKVDASNVAAHFEATASRRAFTAGHMQFWQSAWRPGRGFDEASVWIEHNYPLALQEFGDDFIRQVQDGVRASVNPEQIANNVYNPPSFHINRAVEDVAQKMGRTPEQVRDILTEPLLTSMQRGLTEAGQDVDRIEAVFSGARAGIQNHLDDLAVVEVQGMADRAATIMKATGDPSALVNLMNEQAMEPVTWMEGHLASLGDRTATIRALPTDLRPAAWDRFFAEENAYFDRMFNRMGARYEGILRSASRYGVNVPVDGIRPMDEFRTAVHQFHDEKNSLLRLMREDGADLSRIRGQLDTQYTRLIQQTRRYGERTDEFLFRIIDASGKPELIRPVRAWRATVNELRDLSMQDTREMYRTLEMTTDDAARQAIYAEYTNKRIWWQNRLHVTEREGFAMMEDGGSFGSHLPVDEDTARIYMDQLGRSRRAPQPGTRQASEIPLRQQIVAEERRAGSVTGRVERRLEGRLTPEIEAANETLEARSAAMGYGPGAVGGNVSVALQEIRNPVDRIRWLEAVAGESDGIAYRDVNRLLTAEWRNSVSFAGPTGPITNGAQHCVISAERTGATAAENQHATVLLRGILEEEGYDPIIATGMYGGNAELSFLVPGMSEREGMRLGRQFEQETVLVSGERGGLLYMRDGQLRRGNFAATVFDDGLADNYTEIAIRGTTYRFQVPIDWDDAHRVRWIAPLDGADGTVVLNRYARAGLTRLDPYDVRCLTGHEGQEALRRVGDETFPRRLSYYVGDTPPEDMVRGDHIYSVRVNRERIYDLTLDPNGYGTLVDPNLPRPQQLTQMENMMIDDGLLGYRVSGSVNPNTVTVFEALDPIEEGAHITTRSIVPGRLYTQRAYTFDLFRKELVSEGGLSEDMAEATVGIAEARAGMWARRTGRPPEEYLTSRLFRGIDPGTYATAADRASYNGWMTVEHDGGRILAVLNKDDPVTVLHELGHFFVSDLPEEDAAEFLRILGYSSWSQAAHEDWANQFVRYVIDGISPQPALVGPFERYKDWLAEMYRTRRNYTQLRGIPDTINPDTRRIFDSFLGADMPRDPVGGNGVPGIGFERLMRMAPDVPPAGQGLDELWWTDGRQLMDSFHDSILAQREVRSLQVGEVSPYARNALDQYINHVSQQMGDTHLAAMRFGEIKRDAALLNYNRRTYFDHFLGHMAPFAFWTTHTMWNWALWSADKPFVIADFMRMRNLAQNMAGNMPTRFQGMVRTPLASLPFIPDWLGPVYTNLLRIGLPFDMWTSPFDQIEDQGRSVMNRAGTILEQQLAAGNITQEQYNAATASRSDEIWNTALRQAQNNSGEGTDGMDLVQQLISPHAPIVWAWHVARGTTDKIGPFLPITRTIRSLTALMGWPGGGLNIEGGVRRALGLPPGDRWDDYRNERMVTNMISDGTVPVRDGLLALQEHSGPIWDTAVDRAAREYGLMTIGNVFGIPLKAYPPGEEEGRRLVDLMGDAYRARDAGDEEAVNRFWEEHPETAGRLALFNTPEERLNRFLTDEVWDRWNNFTSLERRTLTTVLGTDFQANFLDSQTRNTEAIPAETLAVWLRLMGGSPPGSLASTTLPAQLPPQAISQRAETFYREREAQFPDQVFDLQEQYFRIREGSQQDLFVRQHPVLRQYWDWRKDWLLRNPDVAPYLVEDETTLPRYQTAAAASAAFEDQPSFTWSEWGTVMSTEAYRLVGDCFRQNRAITGVLQQEIGALATSMGTTQEQVMRDLRRAYNERTP